MKILKNKYFFIVFSVFFFGANLFAKEVTFGLDMLEEKR
jgi:hypothetical protein